MKKIFITLTLTLAMMVTPVTVNHSQAGGIPVFDAIADALRILQHNLQELQYAKQIEQYLKLVEQVETQIMTLESLLSETDIHELVNSDFWVGFRREVPESYNFLTDGVEAYAGGGSRFGQLIDEHVQRFEVLAGADLYNNPAYQNMQGEYNNVALASDATASFILEHSGERVSKAEELMNRLGGAVSTAQKLDVVAALLGESLMSTNDLIRLSALLIKQNAMLMHKDTLERTTQSAITNYESTYFEAPSAAGSKASGLE